MKILGRVFNLKKSDPIHHCWERYTTKFTWNNSRESELLKSLLFLQHRRSNCPCMYLAKGMKVLFKFSKMSICFRAGAITALKECIVLSHESKDNICLYFAQAWLRCLNEDKKVRTAMEKASSQKFLLKLFSFLVGFNRVHCLEMWWIRTTSDRFLKFSNVRSAVFNGRIGWQHYFQRNYDFLARNIPKIFRIFPKIA